MGFPLIIVLDHIDVARAMVNVGDTTAAEQLGTLTPLVFSFPTLQLRDALKEIFSGCQDVRSSVNVDRREAQGELSVCIEARCEPRFRLSPTLGPLLRMATLHGVHVVGPQRLDDVSVVVLTASSIIQLSDLEELLQEQRRAGRFVITFGVKSSRSELTALHADCWSVTCTEYSCDPMKVFGARMRARLTPA